MAKPNRIEQRLARELQRAEGIPYMTALQRVREEHARDQAQQTTESPERSAQERPPGP